MIQNETKTGFEFSTITIRELCGKGEQRVKKLKILEENYQTVEALNPEMALKLTTPETKK